jgi:hypothetical protein
MAAWMHRSGVFADPVVHAAVIDPIQADVDAVVAETVACFARIVEGLEARFNNKDGQPHSESTTHLYG